MTRLTCAFLALVLAMFAEDQPGLKPRADVSEYPTRDARNGVAVGAALLTAEQVRNTFATDLSPRYVVVEVGIYPAEAAVDISTLDFALRIARTETLVRAASPKTVAAILQKKAPSHNDVALYPGVGVGYESGPRVYDPVTGTRRGGGWNTSAGVGVGVGSTRPASTDRDRSTMETELIDKMLPEGKTLKPVCGYLYFPLVSKKKNVSYELEYAGSAGKLVLRLPARTR